MSKTTFMRSLLIALALTLAIAGIAIAAPGDPEHVQFTLEGCRNPSVDLETTNFVCADADYTTGNLGKTWNELDLVPHRVTTSLGNQANATTTFTIAVVADHKDAGNFGYDFVSEPVVNAAKSHASCSISAGALQIAAPGIGGTDESMYRLITVSQDKGTTCVFDYFERLALGSSKYPGASLHSNLTNQNLGEQGVGNKDVSIPVKEILPQELNKDMTATRDADHIWNITKAPTPAEVSFPNTCEAGAPTSAGVQITIEWVRLPASPSGDVTIVTNIYATNPSHRTITVDVTDQVYEGTDQTVAVGAPASSGPVDVPANTTLLVLTHQFTTSSSAAHFNDVATATYTDKITGIPVPGQTEAMAEADVQTGATTNTTATINDVESITGANFTFSADAFSGASGAFDGGYIPGTATVGPVSWTSDTQSGDGSVTFDKTIYVSAPFIGTGSLSDTATLTGSNGFTTDANASVDVSASAQVSLTINKTIPDVLTGSETQTFTFQVKDASDVVVATPSITFGAGETSKSASVSGLMPGSYTVVEDPAVGWDAQNDQSVDINLPDCSGSVTFNNTITPASAQVKKVTIPAGEEAGWEFTLNGPGGPETVTTTGAGFVAFTTILQEGNYTITETLKPGYDQVGSSGDCSFTVDYPADVGKVFSCTYTNEKDANIVVVKQTDPDGDPQLFDFTASYDQDGFSLSDGQSNDSGDLDPGTYSVGETVPAGWDLISAVCDDGSDPASISLQAGETVTCTFTNQKDAKIIVIKQTDPDGETQLFNFNASYDADGFSLADGESNDSGDLDPGTYAVSEDVPDGWDLTGASCDDGSDPASIGLGAGEIVTCTFTNTKRGMVEVLKLTNGSVHPELDIRFTLYQDGPDADPDLTGTDTELETLSTLNDADGLLEFTTKLVPGTTYTMCENPVPAGWTSMWMIEFTVGGQIVTPYNPNGNDSPPEDTGIRCFDFTVQPGETLHFEVHNDFPGGEPRTIGYWKNWNRCTNGGQAANADSNGGAAAGFFLVEDLLPQQIGDFNVTTCQQAVKILSKQDQSGRNKANDAAYELAAQLLAAKLNLAAGAQTCTAAQQAVVDGQALLDSLNFTGSGDYLGPKVKGAKLTQRSQALALAATLDAYNNGNLCP